MEWGFGLRVHSKNPNSYMSALGQKQTFAAQNGMSALPPKADISLRPNPTEMGFKLTGDETTQ